MMLPRKGTDKRALTDPTWQLGNPKRIDAPKQAGITHHIT